MPYLYRMKGIINFTELALMYYAKRGKDNPYKEADGNRKIVARSNFRKAAKYDPEHLKAAKEEYLKAVKAELKKITPT